MNNRSGSHTSLEASTSAAVTSARNMAEGLWAPCRRFFTTTAASWSSVTPASIIRRRARRAK
jgi:hypothetical protein